VSRRVDPNLEQFLKLRGLKGVYDKMLVTEPKMTKCEQCRRRYVRVGDVYLNRHLCVSCYDLLKRDLNSHFDQWIVSKTYDKSPSGRRIVLIRDKCELWIVRDYVKRQFASISDQLLKEVVIGMYHHNRISNLINEGWMLVLLNYRRRQLLGTKTTTITTIGG
jgi:hypothetical protein